MRYAQIRKMDISNGIGIGVALFVQGCDFHCHNCFNQSTWDFQKGLEWTEQTKQTLLDLSNKDYIGRLSILGGEPLHPNNIKDIIQLSKSFKESFPNKKIWIWTGYTFDNIIDKEILNYADYIIDGQYEEDKKDLKLKFRGSSNQQVWEKLANTKWINISNK